MRMAELLIVRGEIDGSITDALIARRISGYKAAFYNAVLAIVCAINENKDGVRKAFDDLWNSLYPESKELESKKAEQMAELIKSLPTKLRVRKIDVPEFAPTRHTEDEVKIKPGYSFDKKVAEDGK